MKKIIFSICALAAIAACTKSEVQYEPSGEISFAPVTKTLTKSVAGYYYGADNDSYVPKDANGNVIGEVGKFDGVFPTNVSLYVFANAQDENTDGTLKDSWTTAYFKNAKFVHNSSKGTESEQTVNDKKYPTTGAYAGDPTRYWPNVKTLKFIGYSAACNVAATSDGTSAKVSDDFTTLTISNYTQDNAKTTEGANDLMYFHALQENGYSKSEGEIAAQMRHACSWITIKVAADANMVSSNCQLNSLKLNKFNHTGNVVCGADAATWNTLSNSEVEYYLKDANTPLTTTATAYETTANNFIVIPQTPVNLDVTYTYTSQEAVGSAPAITLTETKNVPLTFNETESWAPGVHYIYTITITATEILIDPVVVAWTDQPVTPGTTI